MSSRLFIYKYLTCKSLFLKDLAVESAKFLIPKDRSQEGLKVSNGGFAELPFATGLQFPHAETFR